MVGGGGGEVIVKTTKSVVNKIRQICDLASLEQFFFYDEWKGEGGKSHQSIIIYGSLKNIIRRANAEFVKWNS